MRRYLWKIYWPAMRYQGWLATLSVATLFHCAFPSPRGPAQKTQIARYQYTQLHLGVQVQIVLYAQKEATARVAASRAFDRIAALEDIFSHYRPLSEVSRLLTTAVERPVPVSGPLFTVLAAAQTLAAETDGAFDVTVGPLVDLWRASRSTGRLPHPDALADARQRVDWRLIRLDVDSRTVHLGRADMKLDLGGIAKGFILDEAMAELERAGIDRALIEAGGDIVVSGPPPHREGWRIDIPGADSTHAISRRAARLQHAAIATSGDTEQFVEIDGRRYSHVIDPRTGLGLQTRRTATVIAPSGLIADSYATVLTVMDSTSAARFLQVHPEIQANLRSAECRVSNAEC